VFLNRGVGRVARCAGGGFELALSSGETLTCDRLLLARADAARRQRATGHLARPHVGTARLPSLFTFHIAAPWLRALAGISVESVEASVPGGGLRERGALLATHWGLSGPVFWRFSAGVRGLCTGSITSFHST